VGKYENLQTDYETVCKSLGIPSVTLPSKQYDWEAGTHYSYYYTVDLYQTVKSRCLDDINAFDYTFDDQAKILPKKSGVPCTGDLCAQFGYPDWAGTIQNPATASTFSAPSHNIATAEMRPEHWSGTIMSPATSSNFDTVAHSLNSVFGEKDWSGTISNPSTTSDFMKPSHSVGANFSADGKLGW
jgi:hypothetical protein